MGGNFIGATGLDENQEQFDILQENIDANASYINNLVGIPDPTHTAIFGINILNPGLFGLVERAEVNIAALQSGEEGLGTDLSALTTQVEGIETQITGIQGEISTIQGEITAVEGSVSTIQGEIAIMGLAITAAAGVAGDALGKANKSLGIWDEDGNNTYNMKSGNVAIGILPKGTLLNNKLEVNGSINIPTNSKYKINNVPLSYSDLAGTPPVSSKWTNATDVATNIYYSTGNVGIGITTAINNKLEVGGNLNISAGSKYKINNVNLAFSDLGGTLSYNSLTDKLTAGTNISIVSGAINNTLTAGTNISIVGNAINNTYTYTLPTAGVGAGGTLGGVKVDGSTINITNGIISAAAGTPQVNSDWTQTNDNLKSFIQNKPTAGNNISFANNTITNTITGSTTQNIIGLNTNQLIVVDKPNSEKIDEAFVPLTNEPTITSPAFTESIRTFTHSGGTEAQTPYTITIGQNTICDILIVGGGGGGGFHTGGGGGAGGYYYQTNVTIPAGIYVINVGKGGNAGPDNNTRGGNGDDSSFYGITAKGGGGGASDNAPSGNSGGSGGGADWNGTAGLDIDTNTEGNNGGTPINIVGQYYGSGGGGAGSAGFTNGNGGTGKSNSITGTNTFYAAGGGGGRNEGTGWSGLGGSGIGGNGGNGTTAGTSGLNGTGSGGGGGGRYDGTAGKGGSGIVIIKFKSIVNAAIPEGNPITHKTLNFTYIAPPLVYDFTSYNTYASWTAYATSIGATYSLNGGFSGAGDNGVYFGGPTIGFIQLVLPNTYNFMSISFGNAWTASEVRLLVNGIIKATSPINGTTTYSQAYIAGDILKIEEVQATIDGDLKITLSNTNYITNQYTLSVPLSGTGVIINNTPLQYLSAGTYTISVGATQSSVVIAGIGQVGSDPYPLTNGSTIAFKYSMTQKILSSVFYKKDGLIKYVPASGTNPSTGTWQMIDVDSQALTQFAGNLPLTRIEGNISGKIPISSTDGNLPASRLDPIDMSKVSTGILPISRTDGNLPASRLDPIDMSKVSTGNLNYTRITDSHLIVNERFHRIIYAYENVVDTQGVWTNKFQVNTNLHLNYYNQAYNYFQYYLSLSPNNVVDRHKYWFGVVKMSTLVGTDPTPITSSYFIDTSANSSFLIKPTTSSSGVWWLNIWILTSAYCESMLCTLH